MVRIFIFILAISLPLVVHPQQPQNRDITSDDFNKARRQSARRTRIRTYRLASKALAKPLDIDSPGTLKAGVTLWKVERSGDGPSRKEITRRVEAGTQFREGDLIRLSVESPRGGFLYVIDRDWFADGSAGGETKLIFPQRGEDNRLVAGKLIDIPAPNDEPFKASPQVNQAGEMLTIIITLAPLPLALSNDALPVSGTQLSRWERKWSGMTERFEMNGGAGETRTVEEFEATGSRQLTRNDPAPQTIYFITPRSRDGLLFNLLLSYTSH